MRPWIWPGGELGVQRCTVSELCVGDIAVWFDGRELRSHRVVAIDDAGRFLSRGDLGAGNDPPASDAELMGRAVSFQMLGLRYRLDRGLPHAAGAAIVRAPWLATAFRVAYLPPRRLIGQFAERLYTAGPVRRLRRRARQPDWQLRVDRNPQGLRITALDGPTVLGRIHVRRDGLVDQLWVKRSQRGLGLGGLLVRRAVADSPTALRCKSAIQTGKAKRLLASYGASKPRRD